jgi:hypothetical protein
MMRRIGTAEIEHRLTLARVQRKRKRPRIKVPDPATLAWFAGVFEGEGYIGISHLGGITLAISMTDRDVVDRVNNIFPCRHKILPIKAPSHTANGKLRKPAYTWSIHDPETVKTILRLCLPWFGNRRKAKAQKLLKHLRTRPSAKRGIALTHCKWGHEFTPENTHVDRRGYRTCRICRNIHMKEYLAKKQAEQAI